MNPYPAVLNIRAWDFSRWVNTAGLAGLYICAFGMLFKKPVANFGFALMAICFALEFKGLGRAEKRDPLLVLSIAFLLFLAVRGGLAASDYPDQKNLIFEGALKLAGAAGLVAYLFAFWMHRARGKWAELLMVIMAGYLVQVLRQIEWGHLTDFIYRLWSGAQRATFGFSTNRFGLFSAVILLACLVLYRRVWGPQDKPTRYYARILFWGVVCFLSAMGLFFSQSRSAWLCAAVVIPPTVIYSWHRAKNLNRKTVLVAAGLVVLVAFATNIPGILERRMVDTGSYLSWLIHDSKTVPERWATAGESISQRVLIYKLFEEKWKDRPLFGYGPGTSELLLKSASGKYATISNQEHFHNSVFDILVQLGISGLFFYLCGFYLVARQLFYGKRKGILDFDSFLLGLSGIGMFCINGMAGQPLSSIHGIYLAAYIGGIGYASKFSRIELQPGGEKEHVTRC